jgi:hypothetical protein
MPATRSDLFYALLLKDAGCSANAARMAALFGADDTEASGRRSAWTGRGRCRRLWAVRTVAPRGSPRRRLDRLLAIKAEGEVTRALMQARCDRGAEIAYLLGFERATAEAIRALDEHWDGRGQPHGLRGEEIPLLGRILCPRPDGGDLLRRRWRRGRPNGRAARRGGWFDPDLVDALDAIGDDAAFWASLPEAEVAPWEPADRLLEADEGRLDAIAYAFAGVIDAKSPWTYRHSERVAELARRIARRSASTTS